MSSWVGAAYKAYKAYKKSKKVGPTITGVKPLSGKIPWYVSAGKTAEGRAKTVKTAQRVKTDEAITKAEKAIKGGKKKLKDLEATGWTKEFKDYKGKGTGKHFRTGSR